MKRHGYRWWDGKRWTADAADGQTMVQDPPPGWVRASDGHWHPGEQPQPWGRLLGLWVVLSVMGVVAGMASWETEAVDARGCPTEGAPVTTLTIVLWLLGLALAAAGLWVNLRRDRRSREVGVRRRLPIIDVLLLLGALLLPWAVYIGGFNLCWT